MLTGEDRALFQQRFVVKAKEIRKMAKSGRESECNMNEAFKMIIRLKVCHDSVSEEIKSTRIFENIFE